MVYSKAHLLPGLECKLVTNSQHCNLWAGSNSRVHINYNLLMRFIVNLANTLGNEAREKQMCANWDKKVRKLRSDATKNGAKWCFEQAATIKQSH